MITFTRIFFLQTFDSIRVEVSLPPDLLMRKHVPNPFDLGLQQRRTALRHKSELLSRYDFCRNQALCGFLQDRFFGKAVQFKASRNLAAKLDQSNVQKWVACLN